MIEAVELLSRLDLSSPNRGLPVLPHSNQVSLSKWQLIDRSYRVTLFEVQCIVRRCIGDIAPQIDLALRDLVTSWRDTGSRGR